MTNSVEDDDRDKYDHSSHPTHRPVANDLKGDGGGKSEQVPESDPAPFVDKKASQRASRKRTG